MIWSTGMEGGSLLICSDWGAAGRAGAGRGAGAEATCRGAGVRMGGRGVSSSVCGTAAGRGPCCSWAFKGAPRKSSTANAKSTKFKAKLYLMKRNVMSPLDKRNDTSDLKARGRDGLHGDAGGFATKSSVPVESARREIPRRSVRRGAHSLARDDNAKTTAASKEKRSVESVLLTLTGRKRSLRNDWLKYVIG